VDAGQGSRKRSNGKAAFGPRQRCSRASLRNCPSRGRRCQLSTPAPRPRYPVRQDDMRS